MILRRFSSRSRLLRLAWLLIPALAIAAYAPVLSLWFVGDDFLHLRFHERLPWPMPLFTFEATSMFYRPLSTSLSWELGYALFGANALPYHAISLGLHALAAWLLSRAVWTISGEPRMGWLAGALFAVYPLSVEPVAWLAAQWDVWAAPCIVGAVWGYALSWRTGGWRPYLLGLMAALLGVLMKESALPLPLVLPFVALACETSLGVRLERARWGAFLRRVALRTMPYLTPTLLFIGLRAVNGGMGGYPMARTDYQHIFWDGLVAAWLQMLGPLNAGVFTPTAAQGFGLMMTLGALVGLTLWGRKRWPILLLAFVWSIAFVIPVINLVQYSPEAFGSRMLYISLMGFCIALAALLTGLLDEPWGRKVGWAAVGVVLLCAVPVTWAQLQPWAQTSRQTRQIVSDLGGLLVEPPGRRMSLNVQGLPRVYKGSYVFWNGFQDALTVVNKQAFVVKEVEQLDPEALAQPFIRTAGVYNLAFTFHEDDKLYHVEKLSGITVATEPPSEDGRLWDYTQCDRRQSEQRQNSDWQPDGATFGCASNPEAPPTPNAHYAHFDPAGADGKLLLPEIKGDLAGYRLVRLAVCARLPDKQAGRLGEWFWGTANQPTWGANQSHAFRFDSTGEWRVYWTYLTPEEVGGDLRGLRLDPVNDRSPVDIAWVAMSLMK